MTPVFKVTKSGADSKTTKANRTYKAVSAKIRGLNMDTSRIKYNQSPVETPDGSNKVFTLPNSDKYVSGLLEIEIEGIGWLKTNEWTETTSTTFTFVTAPDSDEKIRLRYIKQ